MKSIRIWSPNLVDPIRLLRSLLVFALLSATGCVGGAWKSALEEDSPAGYYRFMREHGDSKFAGEARERLDFHKLYRDPSLAGYTKFRRAYPDSTLLERLYPMLEEPAFEAARAWGTAAAYRGFLNDFASGGYAARAEGNAVFVESQGFGGHSSRLAEFAVAHPESDFAAEAARSELAVMARETGSFNRIGLVLDISAATPERARVRSALIDRLMKLTERMGFDLAIPPKGVSPSQIKNFPRARLEVTHTEKSVGHEVAIGELARPVVLGVTRVVVRDSDEGEVIASREFEIRVPDKAHVRDSSVLFSAKAKKYWDEFFVPMVRWRNDHTIRPAIDLARPVVDVDGVGDRAVVLYEDGDFDLIGLADPLKPVTLASYQRSEDFKKWTGIQVLGDRVAIFGEEGLEFVRFTARGPVAEKTWTRGEIGRVLSLAPMGDRVVIVGAKGMQLLDPVEGTVRRVMRRMLTSVASAGDTLVFADGESVYLSSLALLAENRVIAQLKLGRIFGPKSVRVLDDAAIVTGPGGVLVIDVSDPSNPKSIAKLATQKIGQVVDASKVRGRTFLVGERGLQLLTRGLDRVEETIDVGPRTRVTVMGRHLVTANVRGIQVVDATPWADGAAPAPASAR